MQPTSGESTMSQLEQVEQRKIYKLVGIVGCAAILAMIVGNDGDGNDVPSFFGCHMITKDGKNAVSFAECAVLCRITPAQWQYNDSLRGFCQGYAQCMIEHQPATRPQNWIHKHTIDPAVVEELGINSQELRALKSGYWAT
jgi:hypothetical protein